MTTHKKYVLIVLVAAAIAVGTVGYGLTDELPRHVVGENEIQATIDQQIDQADADRQAIQSMLQSSRVRQIAEAAGLDLAQASAAAAVLSGPELVKLAAQARAFNGNLVGGDSNVVLSTTAIIIILLILILLLN